MLRMSKLTDYGTMVLAQLAANDGQLSTSGQVADATHLGPPTVSKLLREPLPPPDLHADLHTTVAVR